MDVKEVYKLNLNYIKSLSMSSDLPSSPIDLNITKSIKKSLPKLNWNGYSATPRSMKITNNGNTVVVTTAYDKCPYLDGGPLDDRFHRFIIIGVIRQWKEVIIVLMEIICH